MFSTECMRNCECVDFVSSTGFCRSFSFRDVVGYLDNFPFIDVDFVAAGKFLLIIHIAFRKFWISWISIFRPTA